MNPSCKATLTLQNGRVLECNRDDHHAGHHMMLIGGEAGIERGALQDRVLIDKLVYAWPGHWAKEAGKAEKARVGWHGHTEDASGLTPV